VSLDLKRTGSTSLRGFWVLIFFDLIGDRDLTTSKEVDYGVLLLLTRPCEGYSSSWDFLSLVINEII
jgi:hypothetical protein